MMVWNNLGYSNNQLYYLPLQAEVNPSGCTERFSSFLATHPAATHPAASHPAASHFARPPARYPVTIPAPHPIHYTTCWVQEASTQGVNNHLHGPATQHCVGGSCGHVTSLHLASRPAASSLHPLTRPAPSDYLHLSSRPHQEQDRLDRTCLEDTRTAVSPCQPGVSGYAVSDSTEQAYLGKVSPLPSNVVPWIKAEEETGSFYTGSSLYSSLLCLSDLDSDLDSSHSRFSTPSWDGSEGWDWIVTGSECDRDAVCTPEVTIEPQIRDCDLSGEDLEVAGDTASAANTGYYTELPDLDLGATLTKRRYMSSSVQFLETNETPGVLNWSTR